MSIRNPLISATGMLLLVLAGCAEPRERAGDAMAGAPPERQAQAPADDAAPLVEGVTIATWHRDVQTPGVVGSAAAMAGGTLTIRNNCLMVAAPGGDTILPVFPSDRVGWDPALRILTHEGRSYRPGDAIRIGGGGVSKASPAVVPIAEIVARCAPDSVWVVGG